MEDKSLSPTPAMPASGPPGPPGRSRSRRRLNVSSPPKAQKTVRSPPKKKNVNFASVTAPSQDAELSASCSFGSSHSGGSTLDRRLTRSASKRWLKVYESSGPMLQNEAPVASTSMLPPPQPTVPLVRATTCGVTTRLRDSTARNGNTDVNRISQNFFKRLSFDQISNTSDYGTASEHSRKCSVASGGMSPVSDSGHSCASISGIESLGTSSCDEAPPPQVGAMEWAHQPWVGETVDLRRPHVTVHTVEGVTAFIPDLNQSQYTGDFSVTIKADVGGVKMYRPPICSSLRVHHISPIVSMGPHGVQFHENLPVMLVLPLSIEPSDEEWISCLYSNTEAGCQPSWERLPRKDYSYRNGSVVITTNHFSLFTVVLEEPYPEVMKRIRRRTGGRLLLNEVPGVEVVFPHGSLDQDLDAYLRVLYNQEPMLNSGEEDAHIHGALASPVIMLGPHGHAFSTRREPVRIKLPIPHYHEIRARFGNVGLTVWQSSTSEGEPTCWQRLESSLLQIEPPVAGLNVVVVSFAVHHFSFFKVVWDLLSTSLTEAKMGMSYFYPYISFSMMCQAFMEESNEARFGLEVICYRSDKTLPEQTNYRHRVGASTKPKLVRPGRILVRLKSQMFEADIDAGEDSAMSKEEPDFRGRDFEKQYACRFKQNVNIESGTFGKVIVERVSTTGTKNDPLFEFNLNKSDAGHEVLQPMGSERWTAFAMKELASTLQITEGHNWKKFAQHIGFTKSEIKTKFQYSPDPFLAIMNMYGSRGGTPEEFMQALYAVSRDLNLNAGMSGGSLSDMNSSSQSSTGSKGSGSRDSGSRHSRGSGNRFGGLWGYRPWGQVNNDSDSDSMPADAKEGARKRSHPSLEKKNSGASSSAKRRKFSDVSETVSSGSEGDEDNSDQEAEKSNNRHIKNKRRLSDKDMWRISTGIARKDWRFLGRTLGIEERVLVDLEHQYQPVGFRECAYQMLLEWKGCKPRKCTFGNLYSALIRENMVEIAKHMVKILPNGEEDARERDFNDQ